MKEHLTNLMNELVLYIPDASESPDTPFALVRNPFLGLPNGS
jgi:hypothetical protein